MSIGSAECWTGEHRSWGDWEMGDGGRAEALQPGHSVLPLPNYEVLGDCWVSLSLGVLIVKWGNNTLYRGK